MPFLFVCCAFSPTSSELEVPEVGLPDRLQERDLETQGQGVAAGIIIGTVMLLFFNLTVTMVA